MSDSVTTPVTQERVAAAMREAGLIPFLGNTDQVAAILGARVLRVVLPEGHPVQGIAEWPRALDIRHAPRASEITRRFNATTYTPKVTTVAGDDGMIRFRLQHTFTWASGADDAQVDAEVLQFVMATLAAMKRLDEEFPDQWTKGADDE